MKAQYYFHKKIRMSAYFGFVMLLNVSLWASANDSDKLLLQKVVSNPINTRVSGKATLLRTTYTKAINENELLKGKTFANNQEKLAYVNMIKHQTGLRFSLSQDETKSTAEVLYFDGEKRRRDFSHISPKQVLELKKNPELINDMASKNIFTYSPDKTILRTETYNDEGENTNYANIRTGKILFPKFYAFDHGEQISNLDAYIELINKGVATVNETETDNQIRVVFEIDSPQHKYKIERTLAKDKDMATLYTATSLNDQIQKETICSDYMKINGTDWYPHRVVSNKYVYLNGKKTLASSKTHETIPGTVNFNIPIDDTVFEPELPEGAYVIDDRYDPPLEYQMHYPTSAASDALLEPLLENPLSITSEKPTENKENEDGNSREGNAVERSNKKQRNNLFIPSIDSSINKSRLHLFDLASGKIVVTYGAKSDEQEKLYNKLMEIGKGDFAWNGSLITLRKSKAFSISKESHRPLISKSEKWYNSYKLPKNLDLPYSLLVVTNEAVNFFVTISKIEPEGIWITYKKLNADEARQYRPIES